MNILFYPIIIPLVAGAVILVVPKALKELIALVGTIAAAYYAWLIFIGGKGMHASYIWFVMDQFPFAAELRADTLSGFVLFAAAVFALLIVIYSIGFMKDGERLKEYYVYLLLTIGAAAAAILADNLVLLLISWEVTTMLLFLMITIGEKTAKDSAGKTFVMIGFSDCSLLLGIILLWWMLGTLRISDIDSVPITSGALTAVYVLLLIGALVKAGAMPGHSWIPKAAEGAPTSVMAFLPASLDKLLGIYLLARISLNMFILTSHLKLLLLIIGGVTIILAVMFALVQHDLKKLLAYHAVSQVGYMVMGIGTGVPIGVIGGLFHMLNNAIYKCCLFLGAGAVEKRTGTTDLENLGGLAKMMPVTFIASLVSALAISGVPPLNGFVSKWLIYQGTIEIGQPIFLLAAMFGSALTLASFIKVIHSVFLGEKSEKLEEIKPEGAAMAIPMVILAVLCILLGVFAQYPLMHVFGPIVGLRFNGVPGAIDLSRAMWSPTLATILIIIALVIGWIIYILSTATKVRTTTIFVGGEKFDTESLRYPGTGFYETIRDMIPLKTLYEDAEKGVYDLYVLGGKYGLKIIEVFRSMHNGVVSTYIAFAMIGLGFLVIYLVR
ncbi:MAG: NADH-quinone oxidoreductase subunit L [Candidatus Latescibacteria bacterium]|nr:NADH-quinone oxidoreductase subunit L [Candidatus Latescibacterota bacterium]